jgi:hypothetical protein
MKKQIILGSIAFSVMLLFGGCVAIGNHIPKSGGGTVGQQLIDLQKAQASGAITDAEYKSLKAKVVGK